MPGTTKPEPHPHQSGCIVQMKKIPACACAIAVLAGVAVQVTVVVHSGDSDHRKVEAIVPPLVGEHDDDGPAKEPGRQVREVRAITQSSSVAAMPFAQHDWPVPRGAAYPYGLWSGTSGTPLVLRQSSAAATG
jgi:hypothetical protein